MSRRRPPVAALIANVPASPGVYFFFGPSDEVLYVGKSKSLKNRVRSHFHDRSERWMMQRVRRVEVSETAGELGALLLEQRLIKDLKPMFNVASKQKRRIILALRQRTPEGYHAVRLKAVDSIDPRKGEEILGVFKHTTQAKEFLSAIARSHALCGKLLGLERARTYCFGYHLGWCKGACCNEEPAAAYNERLEAAFYDRRIKSWSYKGGIAVEETTKKGRSEVFLVENWCLMGALTKVDGENAPFIQAFHRFDYDTYKILYSFIAHPGPSITIREVDPAEWDTLMRSFKTMSDSRRP